METSPDHNPFESPSTAADPSVPVETVLQRVKLAWQLPAIGGALYAVMFLVELLLFSTSLNMLLFVGVLGSLLGGILFTLYGILCIQSYPAVVRHVLAGITANLLLIVIGCAGVALLAGEFIPDQD